MRIILSSIFILLSIFNYSNADIIFKNCLILDKNNNPKKEIGRDRNEYYISFDNAKVFRSVVNSNILTNTINDALDSSNSNDSVSRVNNAEFFITYFDKDLITAKMEEEEISNGASIKTETEIFINLDKNTIEIYDRGINSAGKELITILNNFKESVYGRNFAILKCDRENQNEDGNSGASSGTAFFINNKGHLLTNNHVVEGCTLSKISYKNKDYDTKLIATDKTLDLALLKAELKPKSFFIFSKDEAKKLNKVYVAGYPLGKGLSNDLKISSGIVSSLKGFEDNSNEIQIDAPINPGNSGGPIINENGDLVAIAVSGLAKDQTEGINFGIKSSAAEVFLRSNKINPKKSMYAGIKENDKLLAILEEGTVYTYCN
jgi:S1-C subfamily serine protease